MSKVRAVARTEYLNAVRSKAFIIGVLAMPVLMGVSILVGKFVSDQVDTTERRFAIVDRGGLLAEALVLAAEDRNEGLFVTDEETGEEEQVRARFVPEVVDPAQFGDDEERMQVELSDRVREGEIFAFVELGEDVIDKGTHGSGDTTFKYYTDTPTYSELPDWIALVVTDEIHARRIAEADVEPELLERLTERFRLRKLGLAALSADGELIEAEADNPIKNIGAPAVMMFLLFMLIMSTTPYMLNAVLEEKMQKISEVLVSAVSPFQLMMGKLVGAVFVSLTLSVIYVVGGMLALDHYGLLHLIPPALYGWFFFFQVLAILIFGSMFSAIGAACSEMRDAQSLMTPAMMIALLPIMFWSIVLESPNSPLSAGISMFPPATPMLMLLRIGIPPGPPGWQVALSVVLTLLYTCFCVWAGGKVFRIGLLSQGQAPSLIKLVSWVFSRA